MRAFIVFAALAFIIAGCTQAGTEEVIDMNDLKVESNSFSDGGEIPAKYTCQGEDISPHLKWESVEGAKAYALLADDPDAPAGTWVHWKIVNIPAGKTELAEGESAGTELKNSFGGTAYGGPCPPSGRHRYFFKLFALDTELEEMAAGNFDSMVAEHAIAKGQIMGTYEKK